MIDVVVALLAGFGVACAALVGYQWLAGYRVFPFEVVGFPDPADPPYTPFSNRGIGDMDPRDAEDVSWSSVTYTPPAPPYPANETLRFSVDGPAGRDLPLEEALSGMEGAADSLAHSLEALGGIPGPLMGGTLAPMEAYPQPPLVVELPILSVSRERPAYQVEADIGEAWPMEALISEAPWEEAPVKEAPVEGAYEEAHGEGPYGGASNTSVYQSAYQVGLVENAARYVEVAKQGRRERLEALAVKLAARPMVDPEGFPGEDLA
jgi:hypothetical protein